MIGPGMAGIMAPARPIIKSKTAKIDRKISIGQNYIIYLAVMKTKFAIRITKLAFGYKYTEEISR